MHFDLTKTGLMLGTYFVPINPTLVVPYTNTVGLRFDNSDFSGEQEIKFIASDKIEFLPSKLFPLGAEKKIDAKYIGIDSVGNEIFRLFCFD